MGTGEVKKRMRKYRASVRSNMAEASTRGEAEEMRGTGCRGKRCRHRAQ